MDLTKRTIDAVLEATGFSLRSLAALLDTDSSRISKYRKHTRQLPPPSEAMLYTIYNFLAHAPTAADQPMTDAERSQLKHEAGELRWQATKAERSLTAAKIAYADAKAQIQVCQALPQFTPTPNKKQLLMAEILMHDAKKSLVKNSLIHQKVLACQQQQWLEHAAALDALAESPAV